MISGTRRWSQSFLFKTPTRIKELRDNASAGLYTINTARTFSQCQNKDNVDGKWLTFICKFGSKHKTHIEGG